MIGNLQYYGAALADAAPDTARPEDYKPGGTAVARDLAFYPTPAEAVAILLDGLPVKPGDRVLEPQAGIGNIVRPLLARGALVDAVEIHPGRADALHGMAHPRLNVLCENFLTRRPDPVYDLVVMNPPFAGTHWMKHVRHAWDFLKLSIPVIFGLLGRYLSFGAERLTFSIGSRSAYWGTTRRGSAGMEGELPPENRTVTEATI